MGTPIAQHKVIQDKVRNVFLHKFLSLGQLIRNISLVRKEAGVCLDKDKAVYWDGRNNFGEKVSNSVYFYTLQADKKALFIRLLPEGSKATTIKMQMRELSARVIKLNGKVAERRRKTTYRRQSRWQLDFCCQFLLSIKSRNSK